MALIPFRGTIGNEDKVSCPKALLPLPEDSNQVPHDWEPVVISTKPQTAPQFKEMENIKYFLQNLSQRWLTFFFFFPFFFEKRKERMKHIPFWAEAILKVCTYMYKPKHYLEKLIKKETHICYVVLNLNYVLQPIPAQISGELDMLYYLSYKAVWSGLLTLSWGLFFWIPSSCTLFAHDKNSTDSRSW